MSVLKRFWSWLSWNFGDKPKETRTLLEIAKEVGDKALLEMIEWMEEPNQVLDDLPQKYAYLWTGKVEDGCPLWFRKMIDDGALLVIGGSTPERRNMLMVRGRPYALLEPGGVVEKTVFPCGAVRIYFAQQGLRMSVYSP